VETAKVSKDGITIGTPRYMSPEQIRGKDEADFRSDVYSLGATLYHMATGRPPFTGASADVLVRKHLKDPVTDPRELNLNLSSGLAAVILKMLAKRPEERYPSLEDLEEDLQAVAGGRPPRHTIHVGKQSTVTKMPKDLAEVSSRRERVVQEGKKRRLVSILVVAGILVIAAAGLLVLNPFAERPPRGRKADAPTVVPDTPKGPSQDELAEELYKEGIEYLKDNRDAPTEAKIERFQLVVKRFPDTRWELLAKDRIRDIEKERDDAVRLHLEKAEKAYLALKAEAGALEESMSYGEALAKLATYPEEFAETEFKGRLEADVTKLRREADAKSEELISDADYKMKAGRFDEAVETLEGLIRFGIPEIEARARTKLEEVREAELEEREARAKTAASFRNVVGRACGYAAAGKFSEAEDLLIRKQEELTVYGSDLERARKNVREARRFADAIPRGAATLVGQRQEFNLVRGARSVAVGKVLGADADGLRLARGQGEEPIPYTSLAPADRVRIGLLALDEESASDHRAAAIYLIVHGHLGEAKTQIDATEFWGGETVSLVEWRDLYAGYTKEILDGEIRKAEGKRIQKLLVESRAILEDVVDRAPWYAHPRFLLGSLLVDMGKYDEALVELERAADLGTEDPAIHFFLGEALFGANRFKESNDAFSRFVEVAAEDDPRLETARARLKELEGEVVKRRIKELTSKAKNAYRGRKWDDVIELYQDIYELDQDEDECLYFIGRAHIEKREIVQGYGKLKAYLRAAPGGRRASDVRRRLRVLEKSYRDSDEIRDLIEKGINEYHNGMVEESLETFDQAIELGPLNPHAYLNRALSHLNTGQVTGNPTDFNASLSDYETTLLLDPDGFLAIEGKALALYYLRQYNESLRAAEVAIQKIPQRWQSYNVAGLVHLQAGKPELAIVRFEEGIERNDDIVPLYVNRALAHEALEQWDKVLEDVDIANKKKPTQSQIRQLNEILERARTAMEEGE
jgi:Flp pilus assembly protein TadD